MAVTESPPFELTEEHERRFQTDGFVIVDRIIDPYSGHVGVGGATRSCSPGTSKPGSTPTSGIGGWGATVAT